MKFITDFFENRKQRKLANKIADLQEQAMIHQRNGNLRSFAHVTQQIAILEKGYNDDKTRD